MMVGTANRRAFLGKGALAVGAVAAVSIPAISMAAAVPSRAAWNAALANVARGESAFAATYAEYDRTETLWLSLRPKPLTFDDLFLAPTDPADTFESLHDRRFAMKVDYERQDQLVQQQTGYTEADRVHGEACTGTSTALKGLMACPAPDLAAAAYEIEIAMKESMELEDIAPVLADLRRLSGAVA